MNILDIRTMRGPNYWSVRRHKLIVMRLDLEELEERPTDKIDGFFERMNAMLPSLYEHRCSEGKPGGFHHRVEEGTWMGHVIEHIALEIQTLAGMDTGFGRTRGTGEHGVYNVVFSYIEERAGRFAAKSAVAIAQAIIDGEEYDLDTDLQTMREIRQEERLGPSTGSIVEEATKRGIPYMRLNKYSLVQLGYGVNQKRIQATITSNTSNIGVEIACDKEDTKDLLDSFEIPIPRGRIVRSEEGLEEAIERIGYPVVTKPIGGNHGRGVTIDINNWEQALHGLAMAKEHSRRIIVEKFVTGLDHRLLVINNVFVAGAKRTPACVVGDGTSTIQELVDKVNEDPRRGYGHEKVLTQIDINAHAIELLERTNKTPDSVPEKDEVVYLRSTANLSTGGTAEDVTDAVHPYNVFMAERISRIVGLDICGIDIMTDDISVPLSDGVGAVIEVNAAPGFRMHLAPTEGIPRNVAEPVIDMLYPPGEEYRIPIIAVTGTNGKTTTTRLIAHLMRTKGFNVGYTTSDGVYIRNRLLMKGDCTGPASAEFVLKDPLVNLAVLESARGGILRSGLGFHNCDMAIVTNIAGDHLGLKDINTVEDMARVKAVVPESVRPEGYAILNADDELVLGMRRNLDCTVALFSMDESNEYVKRHCAKGGVAAVYENGYVTILKGEWKIRIEKAVNIPLTFGGKAAFNIMNTLPAVLAGFLRGFKVEDIRAGLETFVPSPAQTPGRMNMFNFKNFTMMVDYAHNPAGFRAISGFLANIEDAPKIGIVSGVGDRLDKDTIELGRLSAQMFDEIIIRQDRNMRGRDVKEIIDLLLLGIKEIDPNKKVDVIKNENEAIMHAVQNAVPGSYIVCCSDVVPDALAQVMKLKEDEDNAALSNNNNAAKSEELLAE